MATFSSGRRSLIGLIVSLSAALACVGSLACSSSGSSFDMAGSASTTTANTAGSGTGGSGTSAGSGSTVGGDTTVSTGGSGVISPTMATGGSTAPTGGSSSASGASSGGAGTVGGDAAQGGVATGGVAQGGAATGGSDTGPACPKAPPGICHEFIANDNGRNVVNYVNEFTSTKPGGIVWTQNVGSTGANSPRTIELVDNAKASGGKALLVSINEGYVELDPKDGKVLASVKTQFSNVTGACRLPDGTTALGTDTNPAQVRIVSATGIQSRAFNLPAGQFLRAINRDPATGHFWLSRTENVYEINDQGQILWQGAMGAGSKGYAVWWRDGGGAYGTTGELHSVVELNQAGQIVQSVGGDDPSFAGLKLDFFSGFVRRPNGNFIVAHWLGHNSAPDQNTPEVIEFQPDGKAGKAIWTWGNQTLARQITNVYVLR